jgi:outer membrane protein TolC
VLCGLTPDAFVSELEVARPLPDLRQRIELAQYQQSVLLALEDVENALVSYARSQDRDAQLQLAAKDSKRAADLASVRFKNGTTGLLDLLDAQTVRLQAEDAYAEGHSNTALSAVLLYKSLAGGAATSSSDCERRKTLRGTHCFTNRVMET